MQFELRREGPAEVCGNKCRMWVDATGAITAETPRIFEAFAKGRDLRGTMIALNSDGGSVLGAIGLGQAIRRLGMITTVGRTVDIASSDVGIRRARLMPDAYCESMCTFVLLAGVERHVPPEARILVHQIWLGDRRDDPTSATYSAEDLVLVQRDVGRLAQYTMEMGGTIDLLVLALKIPPWEPMRMLSRAELRGTKLVTADQAAETRATAATSASLANGVRSAGSDRSWAMVEKAGRPAIARRHPLTFEGEDIGSFELTLTCGASADHYVVTYFEQRTASQARGAPKPLRQIELSVGDKSVRLDLKADEKGAAGEATAVGHVPAVLVKAFTEPRNLALKVDTISADDTTTSIRLGNAGLARKLPQLAASCGDKPKATRADARPQ